MMGLFDKIPGSFFSVLVSPNREIYVDALMLLHEKFRFDLNITVNDYLASLISILEDRQFIIEDDEQCEGGLTLSAKARLILNRLIKTGWIDKEFMDGSFVEIITPRSYAIQAMQFIYDLTNAEVKEYNSLVFSTYSGLKQAINDHRDQMYEAVLSAKSNTEKLEYELRRLFHGIRGFLREIQDQHDINELLKNHFEEYKKLADRIYHPIKTMDSVHRYTAPIQNILSDIMMDKELLRSMSERAVTIGKCDNIESGEREIVSYIDYVLSVYQSLGDIITEIDKKNRLYTKSSIEKIQYLMTADQTIKGKLVEILKIYAAADDEKRDDIIYMMKKNISVNRQEFFDGRSLYHKNIKSRRINLPPIEIEDKTRDNEMAVNDMIRSMKNIYSAEKIKRYIRGLFKNGAHEVSSEEIEVNGDSDFIMLMIALVRAKDASMDYEVDIKGGQAESNGYSIPNMVFRKKG